MNSDDPPVTILEVLRRIVSPPEPVPLDLDLTELVVGGWGAWAEQAAVLWQASTFEFLSGVEVTDFSDTISGEAFERLFGS